MSKYKIETERADLFDVNMMIAISVFVRGVATRKELENAFHKAIHENQILNTRVIIEPNGSAFYVDSEQERNEIYYSSLSIADLICEQEKIRFRIEEGEYLRLFVDDSSETIKLHFLMHHLGGDGKSLCYFIEDFFKSLNNETIINKKIVTLTTDNIPPNSRMPFWMNLYIGRFNRAWKKEEKVFGFEDSQKAFSDFWRTHKTKVELSEINEIELKQILEKCHRSNIGFTSYFIADLIKSMKKKQDVGIAVDGRLDGNRCMGNQATGISVVYRFKGNKDVINNAIQIHKLIRSKLNNSRLKYFILHFMASFSPTLVDAINLQHANYFSSKTSKKLADIMGYGEKTKDLSITNLTKVDILVDYGQYHIEKMYFIPPVISYGKNVIGLVTVNDKLYVSRHYYE